MCLITFSFKDHPEYDLILAANRDEFYNRSTRGAQFWPSKPNLLAGKDLEAGGTWMGITRSGRFSALTNYRDPEYYQTDAETRGNLTLNYLVSNKVHPKKYIERVRLHASKYNGFNLIVGTPRTLYYISNKTLNIERVPSGVHGLSNHLLDTPWPKVERAKSRLQRITKNSAFDKQEIFEMMQNDDEAPEALLPDTGIGTEKEKKLSSMFIKTEDYGTRSTTVLLIRRDGYVDFTERAYQSHTKQIAEENHYEFSIE